MAIFRPGERFRYHGILSRRKGKRELVAMLSLTAMVDMFTVLVIFLLQNFSGEEQMLILHKDIQLPRAERIKDLRPAFVVTISNKEVLLDKELVASTEQVKAQSDWMITRLYDLTQQGLAQSKADYESKLQNKIRSVVENAKGEKPEDLNSWNKITVQADKSIDILTVKKVMYTISEAGAGEINFAVMKQARTPTQ